MHRELNPSVHRCDPVGYRVPYTQKAVHYPKHHRIRHVLNLPCGFYCRSLDRKDPDSTRLRIWILKLNYRDFKDPLTIHIVLVKSVDEHPYPSLY